MALVRFVWLLKYLRFMAHFFTHICISFFPPLSRCVPFRALSSVRATSDEEVAARAAAANADSGAPTMFVPFGDHIYALIFFLFNKFLISSLHILTKF